jgi:adenylate cyclase
MTDEPGARRLTVEQLATAAPAELSEVVELVGAGMLKPGGDGLFARTDIQRVRAVKAMLSPGISLEQLRPAFEAGYFTLQPIEMLLPRVASATSQTFAGLADELGVSGDHLVRIAIAAGFPAPRPEDLIREDDATLLGDLLRVGSMFGGPHLAARAARILGETTRRAADAGLALFEEGDQMRSIDHGLAMRDPQLRDEMNARGGRLMQLSEDLLARMYRRHLEHSLMRLWADSAERFLDELGIRPASDVPPGFAFVDLAGFSALTEAAGDAAATELASHLGELAERAAARHDGRVVKLLGDGAMLYFERPPDAARGALELVDEIDRSNLPPARGGTHAGPAIWRDGDFFGRTINICARTAAQASPCQVLASEEVAKGDAADLRFEPIGEREMKGIGTMALYAVSWAAQR